MALGDILYSRRIMLLRVKLVALVSTRLRAKADSRERARRGSGEMVVAFLAPNGKRYD